MNFIKSLSFMFVCALGVSTAAHIAKNEWLYDVFCFAVLFALIGFHGSLYYISMAIREERRNVKKKNRAIKDYSVGPLGPVKRKPL